MRGRLRSARQVPHLGLVLAAVLVLAASAWRHAPTGGAEVADTVRPDDSIVEVSYRVEPAEWPGRTRPTLCQIVHHYALGEDAAEATLYLNGNGGRCASPDMAVGSGAVVRLALWARPGFGRCQSAAMRCR